ncbi:hypothetical protein ANANG_G00201820 [Anguilla anguilla]|uniref:Uncharacterized protein n=1 Tax=Anguilla anguilla TaxID=7936 RepID=A0A9D3RQ79_ANGAN|nr:hypothetical protein ANANG_G00201820 [Anguilla anguilla]
MSFRGLRRRNRHLKRSASGPPHAWIETGLAWPIRRLDDLLPPPTSYTETTMEHSVTWGPGRAKVMTSLKTVISHLVLWVVFWCRRLHLLQTTDVRAYRAAAEDRPGGNVWVNRKWNILLLLLLLGLPHGGRV